ncbi:PIN domain-containing protein [Synechococcus sp. C9]|jgi:predicted nucleic acid-binding protein|uniref:PIN domain-containing protein n=1 Tax=Synechococcus sp. C9 TaxID=102119 RepID=UPI001FF3C0FB|nr:PIN domain-containing protein [Synechococcus sp. C9]
MEAEAVLGIIKLWELRQLELVASQSLLFEANQNTNPVRKSYTLEILQKVDQFIDLSDQIENRSRKFVDMGVKPMDSLHLASAIEAKADYFCTCDDRFLKRAKLLDTEPTKVFSPLELALELNL